MSAANSNAAEFGSGEVVEPGHYIDVESGSIVHVHERDELPVGTRVVTYRRTFRKIDSDSNTERMHESAA